ncbi:Pycsar system effector family protein [Agromyces sp. H66]|uniref:Pycsar system effector family protein n=1 Tax=Agromyces sp. H66 TaxID=2529859 RepID=UPI0010A9EEF7|nr:Pycsar system effector family protein [Agromyces sp. H66]
MTFRKSRPHVAEMIDRAAVAKAMLAESRAEVVQADQKASMLLAALGIGFGLVLSGQLAGDWDPSRLSVAGESAWWVGAAFAAASVVVAAAAVWPRYHADDLESGIAYWGHAASFDSAEEFKRAFTSRAMSSSDRINHQLWHLARLVNKKYSLVRWAMRLAAAAAAAIAVAVLVLR